MTLAPPTARVAVDGTIVSAEAWLSDLEVETVRTDAVQSFLKQETIFVRLRTAGGVEGIGYSYTIGTGGEAVLSLLRTCLLDVLVGMDVNRPEAVWRALFSATRATTVGAITSLALAAVDTAVWDARCTASGLPLWVAAGGSRPSIPLYDTEGGWLHFDTDELVAQAVESQRRGLGGVKIKVGKPRGHEDAERLAAVRAAVGPGMDIMVDANQSMTAAEAIRRAALFEPLDIFWFEEPLPAEDVAGHRRLAESTTLPIAVGESMYSVGQFREYLQAGAASIVQVDVARVGGITPWLKVAHLAESFNVAVAPHFLMELHVSLCCAVPNALYLEHIPQLRAVTKRELVIRDGHGLAPDAPGLGIEWDLDAIEDRRVA
ncbi:mandelate racemase/muconate lactonizing enzyme family protein [Leifsonia shinshuensis]|uniref:Mandelate racemase/muconate lactonizing enzyme family protein n=1 Tax=Leifsonia shinshuensis TaxID=150026 RepID=A0A7G6YC08_9MICO|nr:mandelate racemase/muconate lactonizing enzyme family protein [Leifsonia shinshuensis]QNE36023.1 mandelate racemase/muconate lactonizing enzyme family protein [Leifsonia shinshuensis]